MDERAVFGLSILGSLLAWALVGRWYLWPKARSLPRRDALVRLSIPHLFRFVGLSFLVPGVVSPALPASFAVPAAYGDLVATGLAWVAVLGLRRRAGWSIAATWLFNLWGTADLLYAYYAGGKVRLDARELGAAFFIPTLLVPGLLVLHTLSFSLLLRRQADSS